MNRGSYCAGLFYKRALFLLSIHREALIVRVCCTKEPYFCSLFIESRSLCGSVLQKSPIFALYS